MWYLARREQDDVESFIFPNGWICDAVEFPLCLRPYKSEKDRRNQSGRVVIQNGREEVEIPDKFADMVIVDQTKIRDIGQYRRLRNLVFSLKRKGMPEAVGTLLDQAFDE
jgi:hypothetical protein